MLITFSCSACANITMFEDTALKLLGLMGKSNKIPGAILAIDIPAALTQLETNIAGNIQQPATEAAEVTNDDEPPIALANQAFPMIQLLKAAAIEECDVIWGTSSKLDTGL
ncbi:MAG: DUF1840 domain-containing protein [Amphritea sp.]|nr:DUF1840 domain-containing protein [Amphritea sp.]